MQLFEGKLVRVKLEVWDSVPYMKQDFTDGVVNLSFGWIAFVMTEDFKRDLLGFHVDDGPLRDFKIPKEIQFFSEALPEGVSIDTLDVGDMVSLSGMPAKITQILTTDEEITLQIDKGYVGKQINVAVVVKEIEGAHGGGVVKWEDFCDCEIEEKVRKDLFSLATLAEEEGPLGKNVKAFIRNHAHVADFEDLAMTYLFIMHGEELKKDGMPNFRVVSD